MKTKPGAGKPHQLASKAPPPVSIAAQKLSSRTFAVSADDDCVQIPIVNTGIASSSMSTIVGVSSSSPSCGGGNGGPTAPGACVSADPTPGASPVNLGGSSAGGAVSTSHGTAATVGSGCSVGNTGPISAHINQLIGFVPNTPHIGSGAVMPPMHPMERRALKRARTGRSPEQTGSRADQLANPAAAFYPPDVYPQFPNQKEVRSFCY